MGSRRGKILNLPFVVVGCFMLAMTLFFDTSKADETEDITISSNTSWSAGTYTYRDITITNNATLTLQGSYTDDNDGIGVTINARNITIDTGSSIRADGQGYLLNSGPGKGYIGKNSYGSGGAHGGNGGAASLNDIQLENSLIYDVIFRPSKLGSGGGGTNAGSGGGAIIINVAGDVNINGSISANGTASSHYKGGGGSGGTVSITANSVIGSGSISANGGNGNSGGGGGGIVSVYYKENFSLISGNISATGGSGFYGRFGDQGAVIIYNENQRDLNVIQNLVLRKNQGIDGNGQLASDGNYYFHNLSVTNNAVLYPQSTYTNNDDGSGIKFYLSGNLTVNTGSSINAIGVGYAYNSGPGVGTGNNLMGGGGGHGGAGGDGDVYAGGASYGLTMLPVTLGSGGYSPGGGSGGGAIYIDCDGDITLNGNIDASGNDGYANGSARGGGGSGGSIFVRSDSITGSASILSEGGNGLQYSGGGAGGRIAIYSDTTSFSSAQISAAGGSAGGSGGSEPGQTGTIFIYDVGTGDVTASNDVTFEATQGLNPDGSFREDGIYYFNNFTVSDSATVTIGSSYSDEDNGKGVTLNILGDLTVESGSVISANEQGYSSSTGYGKGSGSGSQSGSGASYGGLGGESYNPVPPGTIYGEESENYPYMLGSGGGTGHSGGTGGTGGGAITLRVLGEVDINGTISANGGQGSGGFSSWRPGGGSGGSIFITCDSISGSGYITADGGDGLGDESFSSGAGGGGRISIVYQTSMSISLENITASGGVGAVAASNGSDGSVVIQTKLLPSNGFSLKNPNNNSTEFTNTLNVEVEPAEDDINQYSESGAEDNLVPPFYDSSWKNIEAGVSLSSGEGEKTVKAWLKDTDQLISSQAGQATITVDLTDPLVNIDETNDQTEQSSVTISGNISDVLSGLDRATISSTHAQGIFNTSDHDYSTFSEEITIDESGNFEMPWDLENGTNEITITAYDNAGNENSETITITSNYEEITSTPTPPATTSSTTSTTPTASASAETVNTDLSDNTTEEEEVINSNLLDLSGPVGNPKDLSSEDALLQRDSEPKKSDNSPTFNQKKTIFSFIIAFILTITAIVLIDIFKKRKKKIRT